MRDWIRVTISMDVKINKQLKEKQHQLMLNNDNVSFSRLVNLVLERGLSSDVADI